VNNIITTDRIILDLVDLKSELFFLEFCSPLNISSDILNLLILNFIQYKIRNEHFRVVFEM